MEEFFNLTNSNLIAFSVCKYETPSCRSFSRVSGFFMFLSLKDKSYLLEYAKHVITKDNDPSGVWCTTNEETPSWTLSTVKLILMCPRTYA